jgi:Ca-activated chloride channel family protein
VKALLLAGSLLLVAADAEPPPEPPRASLAERLAFSARERTARGLDALGQKHPEAALEPFESALRLAPDLPLAKFNAGTARLEGGDAEGAAPLLEEVARDVAPGLAPAAWYNLGNAQLAGGDPGAAIAAYRETLRRRADHADAKHNLELALRALEEQKQRQQQQGEQQQQKKKEEEQKSESSGGGEQERQPPAGQQQNGRQPDPRSGGRQGPSPLPQFRDQQDMTAEQAAALLQAVENLERQQRRQRALEQAAGRAPVEKDW